MPNSSDPNKLSQLGALWNERRALRFSARTASEHQLWRAKLRQAVARLAALPAVDGFSVQVLEQKELGTLWCERWLLSGAGQPLARCIVLRPARSGVFPAALVHIGRNADSSQVAGLSSPDFPDRRVAHHLAEQGMVTLTLSPDVRGVLDCARVQGRDEVNLLGLVSALCGTSALAVAVRDSLLALRALEQDAGVDSKRIGLFGHSLGAHVALHAALIAGQARPLVLTSFFGSYWQQFARDLSLGAAHALPGIGRYADLPDLVAGLAPTSLQIQHGVDDAAFPVADAEAALGTVRSSFELAGSSFEFVRSRMGHGTDLAATARFFASALTTALAPEPVPAAKVVFDPEARLEILDRIDAALATGALTLGEQGREFEALAARYTSAPHAVAISSGTAALEVALRVVGVAGRRVLIPANTFFATALAVLHAGAAVDFVDCELEGLGMDPLALAASLAHSDDVAAVVVVHIGGIVAPATKAVLELCAARQIPVIEDAAHALGSELEGRRAGSLGLLAAFSYYPTKIVTSGEGGLLTAQRADHAVDARARRDQGKPSFEKNFHDRIGNNWRLSEVHAAIGVVHMQRLELFIAERRQQAALYDELLRGLHGIAALPVPRGSTSNYYKYIALLEPDVDREVLKARLREKHGVALAGEVYQMPCSAQPYFEGAFDPARFPTAYEFCRRHVCLPLFVGMTVEQQERVVHGLAEELGGVR